MKKEHSLLWSATSDYFSTAMRIVEMFQLFDYKNEEIEGFNKAFYNLMKESNKLYHTLKDKGLI